MDMRLEHAGEMLGSFLSDDLSDAHLGLSTSARAHLDKFRSFLQSYYVAKLGYYPPTAPEGSSTAFPKNVYRQMRQEFQTLYDYLVDSNSEATPFSQQGGICVLQTVEAFDSRHKYPSLPNTLPLLPECDDTSSKSTVSRRLSWYHFWIAVLSEPIEDLKKNASSLREKATGARRSHKQTLVKFDGS
jgi:hypothetical protein